MGRPKKDKPNRQGDLYEIKVTVGHNFDGSLIRKSFYSKISKADAKAKAEQYKINVAVKNVTGECYTDPKATTFESWATKWLETYKKGVVKEHTYNFTYKSNIDKYLIPYFGKAHISQIQQIDIQRYFNQAELDGKPLAKSTLDKQKMILKSIFDAAIDNDLCYKNPVKNIKYQRAAEAEERNVYTKEQADKVQQYAKDNGAIDIVILLGTGIRRSELLGLKWSDIDFIKNTIHIQRAVVQTKGKILIDKPKTKTSERIIPISSELSCYLKKFCNSQVYVIGTDKPKSPSTYAKQFKKFMTDMQKNIDCPILSPHELRHTYGTLLRESGADIYTIQKLMGHSDISVTAAIYVHNDIEVLRRDANID